MSEIEVITGKVWKFGNNVNTDDISPHHMFFGASFKEKDIVFAAVRPDWKNQVKPGDCIVAGENFGCGSHRVSANEVMRELQIGCIVADSVARIYYRTAISIGYPVFACPGVSKMFNEGDQLKLDVRTALVTNLTTGETLQGKPIPPQLFEILEAGGMAPLLVKKLQNVGER
ncbi:3-isopropylmalate dehydratase [Chloroflexota bacterium]